MGNVAIVEPTIVLYTPCHGEWMVTARSLNLALRTYGRMTIAELKEIVDVRLDGAMNWDDFKGGGFVAYIVILASLDEELALEAS